MHGRIGRALGGGLIGVQHAMAKARTGSWEA